MSVEFLGEPNEDIAYNRPAPKTYSETVQWLMRKGYFKSEMAAKIFIVFVSCIFFAISFALVYVASTYVTGERRLETLELEDTEFSL